MVANPLLVCRCTPAGQEEFFVKVGGVVDSRTAPPPNLSSVEQAVMPVHGGRPPLQQSRPRMILEQLSNSDVAQ